LNNKTIAWLKIGENAFTSNQFKILTKAKIFYDSLYKTKNVNPGKFSGSIFFNPENISPLAEEYKTSCEGSITMDECLEALKDLKYGKTPGIDGFPAEFYRFFIDRNQQLIVRQL